MTSYGKRYQQLNEDVNQTDFLELVNKMGHKGLKYDNSIVTLFNMNAIPAKTIYKKLIECGFRKTSGLDLFHSITNVAALFDDLTGEYSLQHIKQN